MQDSQHCMNFSYYYYIIIIIISRPRVGLSVFVVIIIFTYTSKHSDPHCTMVEGGLDHNLNVSSSTKPIRRTATAAHLVDFLCLLMQLKRDEWVSSKVISIDGSLREVHQMHDLISVCLQPFFLLKHETWHFPNRLQLAIFLLFRPKLLHSDCADGVKVPVGKTRWTWKLVNNLRGAGPLKSARCCH